MPFVSGGLVAANVAVYVICMFTQRIYEAGTLDAFHVLNNGEWGLIVWAMFLHGSISHLMNNMLLLFFMGAMIEKEIGHIFYTLLYFLSGIGGNLLSLYMRVANNDPTGSIGASGAVFGMDGVLLAMVLFAGRRMPSVTPIRVMAMIVLSLYSGFSGHNIDNAAHVGGLLTGFLGGCLVCILQRRKKK